MAEHEQPQRATPQRPRPASGRPPGGSDFFSRPGVRTGLVILAAIVGALLLWVLLQRRRRRILFDHRSQRRRTDRAFRPGPPQHCAGPRSAGLLGGAEGRLHLRVHAGGRRDDLRPLSAARSRRRRHEVELPDRRHLSLCNALAALEGVSEGRAIDLDGGGKALVDQAYPKSVHVAFPSVDYQVEVFHPSPERSRAAATSGNIAPVGLAPRRPALERYGARKAGI